MDEEKKLLDFGRKRFAEVEGRVVLEQFLQQWLQLVTNCPTAKFPVNSLRAQSGVVGFVIFLPLSGQVPSKRLQLKLKGLPVEREKWQQNSVIYWLPRKCKCKPIGRLRVEKGQVPIALMRPLDD